MLTLYSTARDEVIKSSVSIGQCNYEFAIDHLTPLLDRFKHQRKIQTKSFYERLRQDILRGCVMPAITIAFVNPEHSNSLDPAALQKFAIKHIAEGYILDGMQRLNTLLSAKESDDFDPKNIVPINLIVAEKYDFLLYRMITLNNGQRPMTARHQIEMLTSGVINTAQLKITIVSEKETEKTKHRGAFRQADISEAYIAYLSNNLHNRNSKIIEGKLDEILVDRVMEAKVDETVSFNEILQLVDRLSTDETARNWLRLGNNLIGFSVGAKKSMQFLQTVAPQDFGNATLLADEAFSSLETSKVNVGKIRREWASTFSKSIETHLAADISEITSLFIDTTSSE